MPDQLVSIVVPAYNEIAALPELCDRLAAALGNERYEVIIIDDGSEDGTWPFIEQRAAADARVKGVRFHRNYGKTNAYQAAFAMAQGEILVTIDADLQDQPECVPELLAAVRRGADMAVGWRAQRRDPLLKRMVSRGFNLFCALLMRHRFNDINSGLKAMTRTVYTQLELFGDLHRFVPLLVASKGFAVVEVPVAHAERRHGASKYRLLRMRGLWDLLLVGLLYARHLRPFQLFGGWGCVGLGAALIMLLARFLLGIASPAFDLFTVLVFCTGAFLVLLGLQAEHFVLNIGTVRQWNQRKRTYCGEGNKHDE